MNHEHPDANLLAAFTEKRLRGREREDLFAHLAECADCRQIAALSSEPVPVAKPRLIPVAWRWAAAAAAVALVLTGTWGLRLGLVRTQNAGPRIASVRAKEPKPAPRAATEVEIAPSTNSQMKRMRATNSSMEKKAAAARGRPEIPSPPTTSFNEMASAPNPDADKLAALPAAPPYKIADLDFRAAKMAAPPPSGALRERISAPTSASFGMTAAKRFVPHSAVLWRVNSGAVEQSLDGGITWQAVSINEGAAFHAIAFEGARVWAGGTDGALFVSRDAGSSWKKIAVAEASRSKPVVTLTGTIVAIRLARPSQIILETDTGGQWISRDGGTSWNRL